MPSLLNLISLEYQRCFNRSLITNKKNVTQLYPLEVGGQGWGRGRDCTVLSLQLLVAAQGEAGLLGAVGEEGGCWGVRGRGLLGGCGRESTAVLLSPLIPSCVVTIGIWEHHWRASEKTFIARSPCPSSPQLLLDPPGGGVGVTAPPLLPSAGERGSWGGRLPGASVLSSTSRTHMLS